MKLLLFSNFHHILCNDFGADNGNNGDDDNDKEKDIGKGFVR